MKKTLTFMSVALLVMAILTGTALAASFSGSIWTNKPDVLGLGYYCTAAQNTSSGSTQYPVSTHWAKAVSYDVQNKVLGGGEASATGSSRAVCNSGSTKPDHGNGSYGEPDVKLPATASFKAGTWD